MLQAEAFLELGSPLTSVSSRAASPMSGIEDIPSNITEPENIIEDIIEDVKQEEDIADPTEGDANGTLLPLVYFLGY